MGMTHYWKRPEKLSVDQFRAAARDIQRLLLSSNIPVAGFEGSGAPQVNEDQIVFNGRLPAACEPFEFTRIARARLGSSEVRSFCKTERLPYDALVKSALIILKHHFGDLLEVHSDDDNSSSAEAQELAEGALSGR